jgi:hypothetical protein
MLRDRTYEEFAKWLGHLMSMVPSHSVDTPDAGFPPNNERSRTAMERPHLIQPIRVVRMNRDVNQDEQAIVLNIRSGLEPIEHGPQTWDD